MSIYRQGLLLSLIAAIIAPLCVLHAQQPFWQPTSGPEGGRVNAVAHDRQGRLYAAMKHGLFRSDDTGGHWYLVGLREYSVKSVGFDTVGGIYATLDLRNNGIGTYKSGDDGATWAPLKGPGRISAPVVQVDPNGNLLISTSPKPYKSTDGGDTWEAIEVIAASYTRLLPNGAYMMKGTESTVVSIDGGITWQETSGTTLATIDGLFSMGPDSSLYRWGTEGMQRSVDGGITWTFLGPTPVQSFDTFFDALIAPVVEESGITIFVGGSLIYASSYTYIYHSADTGKSWRLRDSVSPGIYSVMKGPGGRLFSGRIDGVHTTTRTDWTGWTPINTGLRGTEVSSLSSNGKGMLLAEVDAATQLFRSSDRGEQWMPIEIRHVRGSVATDRRGRIAVIVSSRNKLSQGSGTTSIWLSSDGGSRWEDIGAGMYPPSSLQFAPNGDLYADTQGWGVYRYNEESRTWSLLEISDRIVDTYGPIVISPAGIIYVQTTFTYTGMDHSEVTICRLYRSSDNGATWTDISPSIGCIADLVVAPDETLWMATSWGGPYRSTDRGANWMNVAEGMNYESPTSLALDSTGGLFAITKYGVYRSVDGGAYWFRLNSGLEMLPANDVVLGDSNSVYVATTGGGVYRADPNTPVPGLMAAGRWFPFPRTAVGKWADTTVVIRSIGSMPLHIDSISTTSAAFTVLDFAPVSLPPGSELPVRVRFAPPEDTTYKGTLIISASMAHAEPLSLEGEGYRPASGAPGMPLRTNGLRLDPCTPNPVRDLSTITFALPRPGRATLDITDQMGNVVWRVIDETMTEGEHTTLFDAGAPSLRELPAGIYHVRLRIDRGIAVQKLILMR